MIKGWHKLSLIDYPGHLCTTLFLGGCNFRCFYCHNAGIAFNPEQYPDISLKAILAFLDERKRYLEGVCISGGEPTIHEKLFDLIDAIKPRGLKIKLDTNGSHPEVLEEIVSRAIVDYVAMDIKAPGYKFGKITGVSEKKFASVKESIAILMKAKVAYEFRTTVVPQFLGLEDIMAIARLIKGSEKYVLQPYRGEKGHISERDLKKYAEVISHCCEKVEVR